MMFRSLALAFAMLAVTSATASAQTRDDLFAAPVLRANVVVSGDLVRIGDVVDNAGPAAQIAIYARRISAPRARCRWTRC